LRPAIGTPPSGPACRWGRHAPGWRPEVRAQRGIISSAASEEGWLGWRTGWKRIESPTLVVYAELDPIPEAFSRQVADAIPGAQYAFIRGRNHFAYMEHSGPFFAAVGGFLSRAAA
jgi:pimeloyl-ACP methyl ester carboxylesterase